jgi:HK97 gp10 family phage protein
MTVKVELKLSRLRRVLQGEKAAIDRGANAYAEAVRDLAEQLAPYRTGALRESIHVEPGDVAGSYQVVASAPYAVFVEYGTAHAAAQPFLTPAAEHTAPLPFFARAFEELIP